MQTITTPGNRTGRFHFIGAALAALLLVACSADEGPAGATRVLTIGNFTATPSTVTPGGTTTLSYTTVGAVSCTASSTAPGSSWTGSVPTSGNTSVTVPTTPGNYVYTLTCRDAGNQQTTQTETVRVPAPAGSAPVITTLTATPGTVAPGGSFVLAYTTTNAESCAASSSATGSTWAGTVPTSSTGRMVTAPVTPGMYSYALTCTNATGQQTTQFAVVTVSSGGGGGGDDVVDDGGDDGFPPNDGTTPTDVTDGPGGTPIPGGFVCTGSARAYGSNPTTTVTVNGMIGPPLTGLLNLLGGGTVAQLLNTVNNADRVIDRNLDTFAQYNLTAGLLGALISSVDLQVNVSAVVPVGQYAVFALTFPAATADVSLMQDITITTFLGSDAASGETRTVSLSEIDLLGLPVLGDPALFVGFKTTKPYDRVSISLTPGLLSADVGNAMNVHELCTRGMFITPP